MLCDRGSGIGQRQRHVHAAGDRLLVAVVCIAPVDVPCLRSREHAAFPSVPRLRTECKAPNAMACVMCLVCVRKECIILLMLYTVVSVDTECAHRTPACGFEPLYTGSHTH